MPVIVGKASPLENQFLESLAAKRIFGAAAARTRIDGWRLPLVSFSSLREATPTRGFSERERERVYC